MRRAVDRLLELVLGDGVLLAAGGQQRGLVHDVLEVGAGEPGRARRRSCAARRRGRAPRRARAPAGSPRGRAGRAGPRRPGGRSGPGRTSAGSSTSGRFVAAMMMTPFDESKPSISTRSWFSVCSRSSCAPKPGAHRAGATLADRVDLVQEDQRRRLLLRLLEQLADARGAQADEHLHELRARHEEERDVRLAGDRAREQRLAAPGRSEQQHALGDAPAQPLVLLRVLQEVDDLARAPPSPRRRRRRR